MDSRDLVLMPGEQAKIDAAHEALAEDPHAPRELTVRVAIHLHNEYPKHVTKGKKTVVVNNADEEQAALAVKG